MSKNSWLNNPPNYKIFKKHVLLKTRISYQKSLENFSLNIKNDLLSILNKIKSKLAKEDMSNLTNLSSLTSLDNESKNTSETKVTPIKNNNINKAKSENLINSSIVLRNRWAIPDTSTINLYIRRKSEWNLN